MSNISQLLDFLNHSPTSWHAIETAKKFLIVSKFEELDETKAWNLKAGKRYFVIRNGSVLCAFITPENPIRLAHIIATHTDSPGFKLKPNPEYQKENMVMLGLEVYGGPLITSWLNRDLSIAGRVTYLDKEKQVQTALINLNPFSVVIPQLAIHLDRQVNENGLLLNKQDHLAALAGFRSEDGPGLLYSHIKKKIPKLHKILNSDLFLYPMEPARCIGDKDQLIAGYKLDNLFSVYASIIALKESKPNPNHLQMIICWDHEEVGSESAYGASSPFFSNILERITLAFDLSRENYLRILAQSTCVSVDLAHALHPNYTEKHEPRHQVLMREGIAIKFNAQQRYATDSHSAAIILELCEKHGIRHQPFVTRGDIPCGTTIGPIHASQTGMATIDIGVGQLSMHSCREIVAQEDLGQLQQLLKAYLANEP